ncbi:2927_t:CDS:2, partial [Diversispora eburnea]
RVQKQETNIFSSQKVTELFQKVTDVLGKRNESDFEEERVLKTKYNRDGYTTPPQRSRFFIEKFPKTLESSQLPISDGGLPNFEERLEIDPELVVQEVNEVMIPYSERSFDYNSWKSWNLKSGSVVNDLLKKASKAKGLGIVRCGLKITKPKWCDDEDYAEIQSSTRRPNLIKPQKHIIELLKIKSLKSLEFELKRFKLNANIHHLREIGKPTENDQFLDGSEKIIS